MWGDDEHFVLKKLPLGLRQLDEALDGGFAFNRLTLLVGNEGAGKTLLAMIAMKRAQEQGMPTVFIDVERTWTRQWAETLGIDTSKVIVIDPDDAEHAIDVLRATVQTEPEGVVVLDSIAAMPPAKELEDLTEKMNVGLQARLMNKAFRTSNAKNHGWLVIMINQIREGPVAYGNPETLPGGKGQRYTAWQLIRVRKGDNIEEGSGKDKRVVGRMLKIKVEKNKQGAPYKEAEVAFYFTGEFDTVSGTIEAAIEAGVIEANPGGRYAWEGQKYHGKRTLRELFQDEENLQKLVAQLEAIDVGDDF